MFKKLAESVKQPISFTRIANIVSSTGVKVGTQTIINYIEYAKEQKLNIGDAVIDVVPIWKWLLS
jgi:predicted AAA+ superfamily ATPase